MFHFIWDPPFDPIRLRIFGCKIYRVHINKSIAAVGAATDKSPMKNCLNRTRVCVCASLGLCILNAHELYCQVQITFGEKRNRFSTQNIIIYESICYLDQFIDKKIVKFFSFRFSIRCSGSLLDARKKRSFVDFVTNDKTIF